MPKARQLTDFDAGDYQGPIVFDFTDPGWRIPADVDIVGATISCRAIVGTDNTPQSHVIGTPEITGRLEVTQLFGDFNDGMEYVLICLADFSDGVPREPIWCHIKTKAPG